MTQVTFSAKARQDLLDIGDYIAKDSRENARRFVGLKQADQPCPPTIASARTSPNSRLSFSQCAPPSVLLKI